MTAGLTDPDITVMLYPRAARGSSFESIVGRRVIEKDPSMGVAGFGFELIVVFATE